MHLAVMHVRAILLFRLGVIMALYICISESLCWHAILTHNNKLGNIHTHTDELHTYICVHSYIFGHIIVFLFLHTDTRVYVFFVFN